MSNINFLTLDINDGALYLNGLKLRGIEEYELKKSSSHFRGTAELKITLIVKLSHDGSCKGSKSRGERREKCRLMKQ